MPLIRVVALIALLLMGRGVLGETRTTTTTTTTTTTSTRPLLIGQDSQTTITTAIRPVIVVTTTVEVTYPTDAEDMPPPVTTTTANPDDIHLPESSSSSSPPPPPSSRTQATNGTPQTTATHTIRVGTPDHKFTPDTTTAAVGDVVEFRFYPGEHWIIRGDYDFPCVPYEYVGRNRQGFSSGLQKVNATTDDVPTFSVRINDTSPVFYYSGSPDSCVKYHMMGVINPSESLTLGGYLKNADDVRYQLTPGEPWPTGDDPPDPSNSSIADSSNNNKPGHADTNAGQVAGIVVGSSAALILVAAVFFVYGRRRRESFGHSQGGTTTRRRHSNSSPRSVEAGCAPKLKKPWGRSKPNASPSPILSPSPIRPPDAVLRGPPATPLEVNSPFHQQVVTSVSGELDGSISTMAYLSPAHVPSVTVTHPTELDSITRTELDGVVPTELDGVMRTELEGITPIELPSSNDPGNSPLPDYDDCIGRRREFSWAAPESAYRPEKRSSNKWR